jgi:ribosome-associated protein
VKSPVLARAVARLTLTKKAGDVVIMDLRGLTSMADFFVLCSAESDVQIRAIMDAVEGGMEEKGVNAWHRESGSPHWVLLDYVDVVLHIFHTSTRTFYNLEKLWGDAKAVRVNDDAPVRKPRTTKPKRSTARPAARKRVKAS